MKHKVVNIVAILIVLLNSFGYPAKDTVDRPASPNDFIITKSDSLLKSHKNETVSFKDSILTKLSMLEQKTMTNYWLNIILPSIVALITALIATFFAAYLNRRAEYKKYIFQKRIDIYHEFFNELDLLLSNAFLLVLNKNHERSESGQPSQDIPWEVSKIFTPVKMKASTIYFLLNKKDKKTFMEILDKVRYNIVSSCVDAKASSFEVEDYINEMKELLDTTIINVKL